MTYHHALRELNPVLDLLEHLITHLGRLPSLDTTLETVLAGPNVEVELRRRTAHVGLTTSLYCLRELARNRAVIRSDRLPAVDALLADEGLRALLEGFWQQLQPLSAPDEIMTCVLQHPELGRTLDSKMSQMFEATVGNPDDGERA